MLIQVIDKSDSAYGSILGVDMIYHDHKHTGDSEDVYFIAGQSMRYYSSQVEVLQEGQ